MTPFIDQLIKDHKIIQTGPMYWDADTRTFKIPYVLAPSETIIPVLADFMYGFLCQFPKTIQWACHYSGPLEIRRL